MGTRTKKTKGLISRMFMVLESFFETECQKVMNPVNISYLISHNTGMVQQYYKPTEDVLLQDYLKAIDVLTINEEFRLNKQVQELKQRNDYQKYLTDKKIDEKDEQIRKHSSRLEEYHEIQQEDRIMSKQLMRNISDINKKLEELEIIGKEQRRLNKEYEYISFEDTNEDNLKINDEKFDKMLQTPRQRIKKTGRTRTTYFTNNR
ncbi:MAG: hypothetical protein MRJ93_04715 [Nitrososphaeraceae archaeon]|nr:hypothetical protein [Nitrososphaeraceae archaeon]